MTSTKREGGRKGKGKKKDREKKKVGSGHTNFH